MWGLGSGSRRRLTPWGSSRSESVPAAASSNRLGALPALGSRDVSTTALPQLERKPSAVADMGRSQPSMPAADAAPPGDMRPLRGPSGAVRFAQAAVNLAFPRRRKESQSTVRLEPLDASAVARTTKTGIAMQEPPLRPSSMSSSSSAAAFVSSSPSKPPLRMQRSRGSLSTSASEASIGGLGRTGGGRGASSPQSGSSPRASSEAASPRSCSSPKSVRSSGSAAKIRTASIVRVAPSPLSPVAVGDASIAVAVPATAVAAVAVASKRPVVTATAVVVARTPKKPELQQMTPVKRVSPAKVVVEKAAVPVEAAPLPGAVCSSASSAFSAAAAAATTAAKAAQREVTGEDGAGAPLEAALDRSSNEGRPPQGLLARSDQASTRALSAAAGPVPQLQQQIKHNLCDAFERGDMNADLRRAIRRQEQLAADMEDSSVTQLRQQVQQRLAAALERGDLDATLERRARPPASESYAAAAAAEEREAAAKKAVQAKEEAVDSPNIEPESVRASRSSPLAAKGAAAAAPAEARLCDVLRASTLADAPCPKSHMKQHFRDAFKASCDSGSSPTSAALALLRKCRSLSSLRPSSDAVVAFEPLAEPRRRAAPRTQPLDAALAAAASEPPSASKLSESQHLLAAEVPASPSVRAR
eukprot:TRINITY_DN3948_c0_g2_i1.p1 TRINITY_DN3948_c0_g2~~TRINITY_DN3948_c0_g2_i1.p1  ORF type:complete len:645 (-),score=184.55 TRINITY_DN3948_c0_g2_i1:439-2373(-)